MRVFISLFIMICALQAQAIYDYGVEMIKPNGCEFRWSFHEKGTPDPKGVAWTGNCVANKANGYGLIYELTSSTSYFVRFSSGNMYPTVLEIKDGVAKPVFLYADYQGVTPQYDACNKYKAECDQLLQMYKEMKHSLPKNPNAGKSDSSSSKKTGSSSSSSGGKLGSLGPITPPPAAFLNSVQGERVACTEAALGAIGNKLMAKYYSELHANSMCTASRAGAKAHYEAIITIEQSCPPNMIPQVADMQPLRNELKSALDIAAYSCAQ
ncbi:MAG: hypothetical protein J7501_10695 [Bdellovibrio sp.]|nr:hypothetical protein [Bdellovibrio sp.]